MRVEFYFIVSNIIRARRRKPKSHKRVGNLKFIIMKKKSFNKKLVLNKKTISKLGLSKVKGGVGTYGCVMTIDYNCDTDACPIPSHAYSCPIECWNPDPD